MSNLEIEDVEREMETEKELAEAESKEEGDKKEEQKEEEMELPPIVEGKDKYSFRLGSSHAFLVAEINSCYFSISYLHSCFTPYPKNFIASGVRNIKIKKSLPEALKHFG